MMEDKEFRDVAALLAILVTEWRGDDLAKGASECFAIADAMIAARNPKPEGGIAAIRKRRMKTER